MFPIIRTQFPSQKKSTRAKSDKWAKECADAAINLALYHDSSSRIENKRDMQISYDLYDDILDKNDIQRILDPWQIGANTFPDDVQNYPISNSKVNLLVGEESKRRFDWRIKVTNEDAISEKESFIKQNITESLMQLALDENSTDEQIQAEQQRLSKWERYEAQDFRERLASQIINHLFIEQRLKIKFNQGFKDALLAGREIYCVDIIAKKPIVRLIDPRTLHVVGLTNSNYIEDADIIVEDSYMSTGQVIDFYYDELKPGDLDKLERGYKKDNNQLVNYPGADNPPIMHGNMADGSIDLSVGAQGSAFNNEGDVRVQRVVWKSLRKLGELTAYDENGQPYVDIVDENYVPDETLGEKITWIWVNEWWETTRIANDIYVKMQPRPVQFRRMDNLSICGSGYVGTIYGNRSLMSRMKPFQYMYNIMMYRLKKAYMRYYGPMVEMDMAKMPDKWTPEQWLYYAQEMGYLFIDSFTEGQKGAAQGKLAGHFNTTGKAINVDMGQYISQTLQMLVYIEDELGSVVGITKQREGSIDNRETVGGVERSVAQSSHITEEYFMLHDFTKLRVLEAMLETAKYAYRNDNKVAQYILDGDLSQEIFNIDGGKFSEADYGLVATDSSVHTDMMNTLKQLAQAGIQNDKLNFSAFMDIYLSNSMADTRRKIERYEDEKAQRDDEMMKMQQEHEQQMLEREIENREDMQAHQIEIEQLKADTAIEIKLLDIEAKSNIESSKEPEDNSFDYEKFIKEYTLKQKEHEEKKRQAKVKERQKDEEIQIKRKVANKPKSTSK